MSDRLDRLREGYAAFNRGEFDALRELATEDIEARAMVSQEPMRGQDAVVEWFRPDAFEEQQVEIVEMREHGDLVLAEFEFRAIGRSSGIELRQPGFVVFEFEGDLISGMTGYPSREEAEAAVG